MKEADKPGGSIKLDNLMGKMLEKYKLEAKFNQALIISEWENIVGKAIALKTQKIYFVKDKLFVELSSAPMRHHLTLSKGKVMEVIEAGYGKGIVKDIIFR